MERRAASHTEEEDLFSIRGNIGGAVGVELCIVISCLVVGPLELSGDIKVEGVFSFVPVISDD